ncbi:MAG: Ig-like domain repeat protein, partial [Microgenomates group bacterium]
LNFAITPAATPPVVTAPANQASNEGASTAFNLGSFVDPDGGPWTATINWGDATANTVFNPAAAGSLGTQNHTYAQNGTYTVTVTVADSGALSDTESFTVTVANVAPSALTLNLSSGTINENGSVSLSGSFTDPGTLDTHNVVISWGDTSTTTIPLAAGVTAIPSTAHTYLDDNPTGTASDIYTITVTVTDVDMGLDFNSTTVTVNNVAPSAIILSRTPTTINEGQSTALSGSFTDPGTLDTHTVTINWGDGSANTVLNLAAGVLTIPSTSHTYADDNPVGTPSDIYTITVTVADDDGGSARPAGTVMADLSDADATILAERLRTHSSVKAPSIPEIVKTDMPELAALQPLAPCTNGSQFGTASINTLGTVVQITTCVFAGEYNTITGAVAGQTLTFTDSITSDEITIRSGTPGGPVLAVGASPLTFVNTFTGTIYAHVNTAGCGSQSACRTTTIQCTSCLLPAPATTTVTVNNVNPTATFTNGGPYVFGQPGAVTFSAQADPSAADLAGLRYSYDFNNDGTFEIGNGTYAGSVAAATAVVPPPGPPGNYTIRGRVIDDDTGFTDYTTVIVVTKADTTTTVTAVPASPSVFGQSVTFTATVAVVPPGAGTPTGTVSFNIDGNIYCANTPLVGLSATCTQAGLPALPAGLRNVVALYTGNANFNGSAGTLNYTVNKANTATTITNDLPDPSLVNQPYTVSWTVAPNPVQVNSGNPTGTVTVNGGAGGGTCSAPVAAGSCQLTPTTIGVKSVTATYNGDANFNPSTSTPPTSHTVNNSVTGTVRNGVTLAPAAGVTVGIFQMPAGTLITTTTTNAAGVYTFTGQFAGSIAITTNALISEPAVRYYTIANNNVTGADFLVYANAIDFPRKVTHVTQYVVPGA